MPMAKYNIYGSDVFTFRIGEPRIRGLASVTAVVVVSGQTALACPDHPDKVAGNARIKLCHSTLYDELLGPLDYISENK